MQNLFLFLSLFNYFGYSFSYNFYDQRNWANLYKSFSGKRSFVDETQMKDMGPPKIVVDLPLSIKSLESDYRLDCKATGNPTPTINWFNHSGSNIRYHGFTQVRDSDKYIIDKEGSLGFSKISSTFSSNYFCSATNIFGTVFSRKSEVQKIFIPNVKISYETNDIAVNEKAVIECNTKPDIWINDYFVKHWEVKERGKPNKIISKTGGRFSVINLTKVPQLHIRNVTKDDFLNLQIKCVMANRFISNNILEFDEWIKPKEHMDNFYVLNLYYEKCKGTEISVAQGSTIELPWCSYPRTAKVVWFKSNSSSNLIGEIIIMNNSKFSKISKRYGNILVKNVQISDEGYYFPKKDNKVLQDYTPFHLKVTVKIGVVITPQNAFVSLGNSVTFRCEITGYPVTDIFWLHNGVNKNHSSFENLDIKTAVSTLTIKKVTIENAGSYQCIAESKTNVYNRLTDSIQETASVIITEMSPRLVSQFPIVPHKDLYPSIKLAVLSDIEKIQCHFNATPKPTIQWFLDDDLVPIIDILTEEVEKVEPYTIVATLKIDFRKLTSIGDRWKYGGMYVAEAINQYGKARCRTLAFVDGVFLIRDRRKITHKHDQAATLTCYVISSNVPEITWSKIKDGKNIKFPDTHLEEESKDRREIYIKRVNKLIHDASYQCNATCGGKTISKVFNVSVARPPLGVKYFQQELILYDRNIIEYNCEPLPDLDEPWYSWWEFQLYEEKNNKSVIISPNDSDQQRNYGIFASWWSEGNYKAYNENLPDGVPSFLMRYPNIFSKIKIKFVSKLNMAVFTCVIQNNAGMVNRSFRITIAVIEFNVTPPSKMNVTLGGSFIINCSPKPNQLQTITIWSHNQKNISIYKSNVIRKIFQFPNGTLVVNNINESDPTEFLCIIKSSLTELLISKLVQINLQVPARILPMENNIDVVKKSNFDLVCSVKGDQEKLYIEWYKEEDDDWKLKNSIKNPRFYGADKKTTKLFVPFQNMNDEYAGRYKCVARNAYNKNDVEKIVQISVVAVPGKIDFRESSLIIEARSISMKWNEPSQNGNKQIINYVIRLQWENNSLEKNITEKQILIKELYPNQQYNISIRAENEVGLGDDYTFLVTTLEASPEGPVVNLSAFSNSSTSLILTWKPPKLIHQNGKILKYEVCYRRITTINFSIIKLETLPWPLQKSKINLNSEANDQKTDADTMTCIFVNLTNTMLKNLPKFTGYAFGVRAVNNAGTGPFAHIKERTMEDLPEKEPIGLTCTPKSTQILLQWNPPPQDSINGVSKGYKVSFFRPEHYGTEEDGLVDGVFETKLTLFNLIPYSNYSIQVAVVNQKGSGPFSAPLICVTSQDSPSAPEVVKAFKYNTSCVLVVWSPPLQPNGPLKQYCVNVRNLETKIFLNADTQQSYFQHIICGLTNPSDYIFEVTAHNNREGRPGVSGVLSGKDMIISIPRQVSVTEGTKFVIDCETMNRLEIPKWYHYSSSSSDKKEIDFLNDNYQLDRNGSLIVLNSKKDNNGTYTCVLGKSVINYSVSVKDLSNGSSYKTVIFYHTCSLSTISIEWKSAASLRSGDPIIGFFIDVYHKGVVLQTLKIDKNQRSFIILNLTCGTTYDVKLYAEDKAGNNTPAELTARTRGTVPLWANSTNLLASVYSHSFCFRLTSFNLGDGCPPDKFIVTLSYTFNGYDNVDEAIKIHIEYKDIHEPCNNITGLNPSTDYRFEIEAINNAGSTVNKGYNRTLKISTVAPSLEKVHNSGILNMIYNYKYYIILIMSAICIVVFIIFVLYCMRRKYRERMQPPQKVNNNLRKTVIQQPLPPVTPSLTHRNRKLPAPPCNTYDTGILSTPKITEEDDDLKPYATYAPVRIPEYLSPNTRAKQGKKSLTNDPTAYNAGSQTHSYQYPDMVGSSQQQPVSSMEIHNTTNNIEYNNSSKQPLLKNRTLYSKGYSVGGEIHCPLLSQRPSESICQEPYRPGGSTWSNTTGSSTKELNQVFHANYSVDLGLREQDEENCSTTRAGTITALPNRMRVTEDYLESCSSGDDPGIQMFTQERFSGQQAIEPKCIRQISTASSTYSSVDDPLSRNLGASLINPGTSSYLPSRFLPQDTLTEEDEQNNYQNKFVIV